MVQSPERRLMIVLDSLKAGGTERQTLLLAAELSRRGWRVRLVSLTAETPLLAPDARRAFDVRVIGERGILKVLPALFALVREFRPGVVQSSSLRPHGFCLLLKALGRRFRWVVAVREALPLFHFEAARFLATDLLVFWARLGVDAFLSNSRHALERKGVAGTVIGNLLDPGFRMGSSAARASARRRLGLAEDAFIIGAACNTTPYKGLEDLVDAAARLAASEPRLLLVLAGEERGDYGRALMHRARETLGARFLGLGLRDDLPDVMPAFDAYCSASLTESSSNAVAEAMACGLPCVVTDAGDSAELVGDTGWVVPTASPDRLAAALGEAAREAPAKMADRGLRSRARIERLRDPITAADAHERFYRALIGTAF